MRKFLAIVACKVLRFVGKLVGKGSSLPGKYALKLCPDILRQVELPKHIIAVTGSNGKTSTVEMIAAILRAGTVSILAQALYLFGLGGQALLQIFGDDLVLLTAVGQLGQLGLLIHTVSRKLQRTKQGGLGLGATALQVDLSHFTVQNAAELLNLLGGGIGDDAELKVCDVQGILLLHRIPSFLLPSFCTKIRNIRQNIKNVLEIQGIWEYNRVNTTHYPYYNTKIAY